MRYFWTRFLPSYPNAIVYMLQGSEYRIADYLKWLHRTSDFRSVMKRRQLDRTKKAGLLLSLARLIQITLYLVIIFLEVWSVILMSWPIIIASIILLAVTPFIICYGIVLPLWLGYHLVQKPRQRGMIAAASKILENHPAIKIAIAGSYGKTTAKEILQTILSEGKEVAFTPGNMNTPIGISRFANKLVGDEEIIIFELGEEKVGDVKELCELVQPDMGIITGINEAHLSSFGTLEKTVATVFELQDYLGDGPIYKNQESPLVAAQIKSGDKLAFGRAGTNGWKISGVKTDISGTSFVAKKGDKSISAHTGLLGEHNLGALIVAIDIASSMGLSVKKITAGIEKTVPFEHRMQPRNIHGAWVIDDTYNGNSEGVCAGLLMLGKLEAKRRVYVTPGLVDQGNKTQEVHESIGHQIAAVADVAVLMKNSVTDYILTGLNDAGFKGQLMVVDDPLEFYTNLEHFVVRGDVVLMQNDWPDNYK